eukprot:TRINITY_DN4242_c0_g2_i3.p1 TRINITY_DN4242_c0_g2~~TRINITY_DN4242_c0_g2_i3.p1  ORF type:complete len:441 (+),score=102.75 TRINITY_DN4242_c0_g2_i3:61-1323(+)
MSTSDALKAAVCLMKTACGKLDLSSMTHDELEQEQEELAGQQAAPLDEDIDTRQEDLPPPAEHELVEPYEKCSNRAKRDPTLRATVETIRKATEISKHNTPKMDRFDNNGYLNPMCSFARVSFEDLGKSSDPHGVEHEQLRANLNTAKTNLNYVKKNRKAVELRHNLEREKLASLSEHSAALETVFKQLPLNTEMPSSDGTKAKNAMLNEELNKLDDVRRTYEQAFDKNSKEQAACNDRVRTLQSEILRMTGRVEVEYEKKRDLIAKREEQQEKRREAMQNQYRKVVSAQQALHAEKQRVEMQTEVHRFVSTTNNFLQPKMQTILKNVREAIDQTEKDLKAQYSKMMDGLDGDESNIVSYLKHEKEGQKNYVSLQEQAKEAAEMLEEEHGDSCVTNITNNLGAARSALGFIEELEKSLYK